MTKAYTFDKKRLVLKVHEDTFFEKSMVINGIVIYPNILLKAGIEVGINTILGFTPIGFEIGELETVIGENSRILTGCIIYAGNTFGQKTFIGHKAYIREKNEFGDFVQIGTNSEIEGHSYFGDKVKLHTRVHVGQYSYLKGKIFIAPGTVLTNDLHPPCGKCLEGPKIDEYVAIGSNVTIAPRVRVGRRSIIGAGAVVTKDVEPESIVAGVPARKIGSIYDIKCDKNIVNNMPDGIFEIFDK